MLGLANENPAATVMWRALLVMVVCWPIGYAVGTIAQHAVQVHLGQHQKEHPIPTDQDIAAIIAPVTSTQANRENHSAASATTTEQADSAPTLTDAAQTVVHSEPAAPA